MVGEESLASNFLVITDRDHPSDHGAGSRVPTSFPVPPPALAQDELGHHGIVQDPTTAAHPNFFIVAFARCALLWGSIPSAIFVLLSRLTTQETDETVFAVTWSPGVLDAPKLRSGILPVANQDDRMVDHSVLAARIHNPAGIHGPLAPCGDGNYRRALFVQCLHQR